MTPELAVDPSGEWPAIASDLEVKVARVVTWVLTAAFACVVLWEIGAPLVAGHYASSASMGIIADNMRRWGIVAPVWLYTAEPPDPSLYYCHHPFGIFWTTTILQAVFGRSDLTCRLAPAILSVLTVPLLSALGRALYRPLAGAVMAAFFVASPIALSFAQFNALEVPVIAWSTLALWGWVRSKSTGQRRHIAAMLVGSTMAMHADWPAFVLVGLVLGVDLLGLLFGRSKPKKRVVIGWALLGLSATLSGLLYLWLFSKWGMLQDLSTTYELRRGAEELTLRELIDGRSSWDEWMLTRAFFWLTPLGIVAALVRCGKLRRAAELVPVLVLAMAAVQYGLFRQGAWIHVFWPHYFALGFALAAGALVAFLAPVIARAVSRHRRLAGRGHLVTVAGALLVAMVIARDGIAMLIWARRTGGRFDERGLEISSGADDVAVLRALSAELPPEARIGLHESVGPTWAHTWALGGRVVDHDVALPYESDWAQDLVVADLRGLRPRAVERLLACCSVRVVDHLAIVTPGEASIRGEGLAEREPSPHERLLGAAFEPVRTIHPSPFSAWLVADHYGGATPEPSAEPRTTVELAIAYDAALAAGDPSKADGLRRAIEARLSGPAVVFDDETRLLGFEPVEGVAPRLVVVFAAAGPLPEKVAPRFRAKLVETPALSLARQHLGSLRDLGPQWLIAPSRWKASYLYTATVELLPRPGVEAYEMAMVSKGKGRAPRPVSGGEWVEVHRR